MATVKIAERGEMQPGQGAETIFRIVLVAEDDEGNELKRHTLQVPADNPNLTQERLQGYVDRARTELEAVAETVQRVDLDALR
jgi:hypothetical protein